MNTIVFKLVFTFAFSFIWCCQVDGQDATDNSRPLKVFLLVGQSNMQGHARIHTLEHVGMDPKTRPIYETLSEQDGKPKVIADVWINSLNSGKTKNGKLTVGYGADESKMGPELAFGAYMQKSLEEPILIIKTAWGGKSLNTDFRPPSGGVYEFSQLQIQRFEKQNKDIEKIRSEKKAATGKFYRLMMEHIKTVLADIESTYLDYDPQQGYKLAGFVWFQGWNDMVDGGTYPDRGKAGGYDLYSELLAKFIRDIRKDLSAPNLPFVIGVMGVGGPTDQYSQDQQRHRNVHQNFRDAMAAPAKLPEFKDNVSVVFAEQYWDQQLNSLNARKGKIQNQVRKAKKEKQLDRKAEKELRDRLLAEEFSDQEKLIMEKGISNQAYHYLGSAKIMTQIGKAFAEAMSQLQPE